MRTYLITGANRGIGLEFSRQLVEAGDYVIATARKPSEAKQLAELEGENLEIQQLDVTDDSQVEALARTLDGRAIDTLINNAGIAAWGPGIDGLKLEDVQRVFDTNVMGPIRVTRALLGHVKQGSDPVIAHITSRMGSIADNGSGGAYAYRVSKAGLNMFNKSLSLDDARSGVTCVVLHPGWVQTDMGGANATITPPESVTGLLKVVRGLKPSDNGKFYDYTGEEIPW